MPKKKKKSKKLVISFHAISIAIIVAAYVLLIVGSYYWKDDHWYQVFNPFAKFPTDPEAPEYALDMLVRILSLCLSSPSPTSSACSWLFWGRGSKGDNRWPACFLALPNTSGPSSWSSRYLGR